MRHILASLAVLAPLALTACGGTPEKETVLVQQPNAVVVPAQPQTVVVPAQPQTVVVPQGSVRTCTAGTLNCP
ncbi:MAG TPA: hypothetical protein VGO34_00075 [Alphaproteobacteria bacterium]|jgi:ABC-type Fe3+-hydroxamate transport system substrate-binding protein